MGSLLMSEIRRSGVWHFGHRVSIPNTLRNNSDHLMYLDLGLGLSWSAPGGVAAGGPGTAAELALATRVRCAAAGSTRLPAAPPPEEAAAGSTRSRRCVGCPPAPWAAA
jgi:hypothetical protein